MKEYDIYVQDIFYKRMSAIYVSDILSSVSIDIQNNLISYFDNSKPASIKIIPVT